MQTLPEYLQDRLRVYSSDRIYVVEVALREGCRLLAGYSAASSCGMELVYPRAIRVRHQGLAAGFCHFLTMVSIGSFVAFLKTAFQRRGDDDGME